MDAIVLLRDVTKRYRGARSFIPVLESLDLEVARGEFLGITGPSGSGKTTLLNLIGGLDRADSGSVTVAGTVLNELDRRALARWRAGHIGFVFQSHYLMPMLTAASNVALPLMLTRLSRSARRKMVARALEEVGLSNRATHRPGQLSGGQQRRVGIARALVTGAPILLCDEPTAGLDHANADAILALLNASRNQGRTIIMVTHDPLAASFADRRVEMAAVP